MSKFNSKVRGTNLNSGDGDDNSTGEEISTVLIEDSEAKKYEKRLEVAFTRFWQSADLLLTQCRQISLTPMELKDISILKRSLQRLSEYLGVMETAINQHRKSAAVRKNF